MEEEGVAGVLRERGVERAGAEQHFAMPGLGEVARAAVAHGERCESRDDAADKMKAMQDKITADLVGAGIEVRPSQDSA